METKVQKMLYKKDPIPADVAKIIRMYGLLTGSKAFGCFNANPVVKSDIDYILPPDFPYTWNDLFRMGGVYSGGYGGESEKYNSIYINMPDSKHIHNLLLFKDRDLFQVWWKATLAMVRLVYNDTELKTALGVSKEKRVALFTMLKEFYTKPKLNTPFYSEPDDDIPF
jgi:hypothetical protein